MGQNADLIGKVYKNGHIPIIWRDGKVIEYPRRVYGMYSTALEISDEIAERRNRWRRLFPFWR